MPYQMPITRRRFGLAFGSAAGAALAAAPAVRVNAQAPLPFNLGYFTTPTPQYYEKATGSLGKALEGRATVNFISMPTGPQFIAAMAGGSLDCCAIGAPVILSAIAQRIDVSMVYVQKVAKTSEALVVKSSAGITSLAALKGKKIGVPFNTTAHFALIGALSKGGLKSTDVELLNMKPDALFATWARNDIDAAYIWYPYVAQLAASGGNILFTTADLEDMGLVVFDGIVVRNDFKRKHPDILLDYLKDVASTDDKFRSQPDAVVADFSRTLSLPADTTKSFVQKFETLTPSEMIDQKWMGAVGARDTGIVKSLRAQAEFLVEAKQITAVPADLESFIDSSFLKKMI